MLRIPNPGEPTPPLVAKAGLNIVPVSLPEFIQRNREKRRQEAAGEIPPPVIVQPEPIQKKRRRDHLQDESPDWEKLPEERVRVGRRHHLKPGRIFSVALAVLSLIGALLVFMRREKPVAVEPIEVAPSLEQVADTKDEVDPIELPLEMRRNESEFIAEVEPIARQFLEAKSVEDMLPLVRDRAKVEPKMRAYYTKGVKPAGLGQFNTSGSVVYRGNLSAVSVRTGDFEIKQLAFIRTPEGLKIDWESYVGWSEMSWTRFIEEKPENPVLFRTKLVKTDYYNFQFSSDVEWRSFQLTSVDDESTVYGYVKVGSELERKLTPENPTDVSLMTLKLKYPAGPKQRNQVLIDSVVADGWVEGMEK